MNQIMKIYASTPVRICDFGGLTDTWFSVDGHVLNFCIDSRIKIGITLFPSMGKEMASYAFIDTKSHRNKYIIRLTKGKECLEQFISSYNLGLYWNESMVNEASNQESVDCILQHYNLHNYTIYLSADTDIIPGSSLGTSASISVALYAALWKLFTNQEIDKKRIIFESFNLEASIKGCETGIQDQIAAIYGGINYINVKGFNSLSKFPEYNVHQINIQPALKREIEERMLLVYIGFSHDSSLTHKGIIANLKNYSECRAALIKLKEFPKRALKELYQAEKSLCLDSFGEIMRENNYQQTILCRGYVSDGGLISDHYRKIIDICDIKSVLGYKMNGAGGGGGTLSVLCRDLSNQQVLIEELKYNGYICNKIKLSTSGLEISDPELINI